MLLIMGILAAGVYLYFNPQHRPEFLVSYLPASPTSETRLYRWKDENGEWVVSDQLPRDIKDYEVVSYRHDANVLPDQSKPD